MTLFPFSRGNALVLLLAAFLVRGQAAPDGPDDSSLADKKLQSAPVATGTVTGAVIYSSSARPVEFVAVTLKKPDGTVVQSTATDSRGRFTMEQVPAGGYYVVYNQIGAEGKATPQFTVDAQHPRQDFSNLDMAESTLQMDKFEVKARQETFLNSIDRKVYNVGKEIQSTTGSASDLLQNIPSVGVDIDGNVSLRGSDSVLILINGRTSTLMGKNRAEALQQLPADEIEKIEVITNPSAKYKPDGTAGIINIALKRKHEGGFSGTATTTAGNNGRYAGSLAANYHPGPYNISGSYSVRRDDRPRHYSDIRTITDPVTGAVTHAEKTTVEDSRPLSHILHGGLDFAPDGQNQFGLSGNYNRRTYLRRATDHNVVGDGSGVLTSDYDRIRHDPEYEQSREYAGTYHHGFADEGHELNLELRSSTNNEEENNHYTNNYRFPAQASTFDNTIIYTNEHTREGLVEYVRPFADGSRFEAGYTLTDDRLSIGILNEDFDPVAGRFITNVPKTSSFIYASKIHAFYATYARLFGQFGFLAGLRPEFTYTESNLITTGQRIPVDYARVYPSLHLTYRLTDQHEFQVNYSHRVHRPDTEDLNPFPEFIDPFNLRAGNPYLRPEDIHSVEAGYSFRRDDTTLTAILYHRYLYHRITNITTNLGNGILLTTKENLDVSRATGLELTANANLGSRVSLNFSSNTFFNTIDASTLGFSGNKSDVSWLVKAGTTVRLTADMLMQFNVNYDSARVTPQGVRLPSYVANLGLRRDFWKKKAAVVFTISDLFDSQREAYRIDTPALRQEVIRRRTARILNVGLIYNFGQPAKKAKDDLLKFDNSL